MVRRKDRIQELTETMEAGIRKVFESDRFHEWLDVQAQFHQYSFNNTIAIMAQHPNATRVAGYRTWQKIGRQVKKGESAIWIWAPRMKTIKDTEVDGETGQEIEVKKRVLTGFVPVPVFDIAQTEGEDLPELDHDITTDTEAGRKLLNELIAFAEDHHVTVTTYEGRQAKGYFDPKKREIGLRDGAVDQQAKTLIHELAHALTHDRLRDEEQDYAAGELVAEGAAHIVATHFGLDPGYSFEYLAVWMYNAGGDMDVFRAVLGWIQGTAKKIIDNLDLEEVRQAA